MISPSRGERVVKDTDIRTALSEPRTFLQIVVFPAPEGAEMTKIPPLLLLFLIETCFAFKEPLRDRFRLQGGEDDMVAVGDDD